MATVKYSERTLEKKKNKSGKEGEAKIKALLNQLPKEYIVINNLILDTTVLKQGKLSKLKKSGKESSTQIDHLVISPYGIFVIETKNHTGVITGNPGDMQWYQGKYDGTKDPFYNPYYQNIRHIDNLYKLLDIDRSYFTGIIVFSNDKADLSELPCSIAIDKDDLLPLILSYTKRVISSTDVFDLFSYIESIRLTGQKGEQRHKKFISRLKSNQQIVST